MSGGRFGGRTSPYAGKGVWSLAETSDRIRLGLLLSNEDPFDVNSIGNYTQSSDTAATWSIASSELSGVNGAQSVFIRNGTSYADVKIECDINQAQDAGLIVRFIDNLNYYLLALSDDSGAAPTQSLRIFKRVAGTYTQLAVADFAWARGTSKTVRFAVAGTTLSALVDGTLVLSVTDSAFADPGGVGMRNNASTASKYQAFRWGA